ncbi:Histidine kinase [Flagellimonas maritima]|uniref:histidine kinase n=1 Tax=Flagellimonas maritima TaxID=1383885 RepID=A0A2Z4LX97_9FLAO|nr:tetratricopeptide repeat-containing sensor histidine kinase [Allomuricauda aurantiaca]AWX46343.1 Histidine kinase [Allomuricauda aurantiaca]
MKLKRIIQTILLLLLSSCIDSTSSDKVEVDSKTLSIEKSIQTVRDSVEISIQRKKNILENVEKKINDIPNDTLRLKFLSDVSLTYKMLRDSLKFREINQNLLELSNDKKMYATLGNSHWDLASFYKSYGILDSAYFHYRSAYKSFDILPTDSTSSSRKGRMLYSMGQIQDSFKDYLGAETSITSALKIFLELEDSRRIYNCYNMLGIVASGMNNYSKSLEYYEKASDNLKKLEGLFAKKNSLQNKNNIANIYSRNGEFIKAKKAYDGLINDQNLRTLNPKLYSKVLVSQANVILKNDKNLDKVGELLSEAFIINDSIGFSSDQARAKQYYAELLAAKGDTTSAQQYAKESRMLAKNTLNNDRHLKILRVLTKLDSENAVAYSNEYYDLNEKVKEEERAIRDKFARVRLETDEVIQRNEVLSREKEIWIGVVFGLLILGVAIFTIIIQRINNNKLKFQQKQQESNQEIYNLMLSQQGKFEEGKQLEQKRISEELHDGILGQMLGIRLILSGLNDKEDEASIAQRAELIEKLRELEEEIRTISHELSDASYQKFYNFIVSLEELINTINASTGILCSFTYDDNVDWDDLKGDIKINAYRIVQESLQNSIKHAKCKNITIDFKLEEDLLKLTISDDGTGFDINRGKHGIGLKNVVSRVKKVKGKLDIESKKGKGTTITVTFPNTYINVDDSTNISEHSKMMKVWQT